MINQNEWYWIVASEMNTDQPILITLEASYLPY